MKNTLQKRIKNVDPFSAAGKNPKSLIDVYQKEEI